MTSSDVDGGAPTYSISGADAALFSINAAGVLTFNVAPDRETPADAGGNNVYDVIVQVADGNGGIDTQAIAITVTNVNEAPVITSDGGGATATLNAAENQTAVTTVTSSDVDGGAPTYSIIGGADAALFSINAAGVLTFNVAPDRETPADAGANNVYDVTVQVADGNGGFDTQAIAITVTNINEAPVITSDGGAATATISVAESQTAVTTVTSVDLDGGAPTYSIIGGADAALFSINAAGVLTFNTAPDREASADAGANNVYDVIVQVADGNGGFDTQAIAITVIHRRSPRPHPARPLGEAPAEPHPRPQHHLEVPRPRDRHRARRPLVPAAPRLRRRKPRVCGPPGLAERVYLERRRLARVREPQPPGPRPHQPGPLQRGR